MVFRNTFTQNVYISFEKARKINYNVNDLSLFDAEGKPKEYGQDYSTRPKRLPGQERPNHKYIERKTDPKNPGKFIYIYEREDGTRFEEHEPEPEVTEHRKFTVSDLREMAKKNPPEPSLFDHPDDTAKQPFIHQPEGLFSSEMAQEYAEKNKHLIGDGFTYQALHDPEITNDRYENISGLIQSLAQTGNETAIPYEEMQKKVSQYDLEAIDPEGKVRIALEPQLYMPVAGPLILKQLNELQIEYDKQHPAPPAKLIAEPEAEGKKDINTQVQELLDAKQKNKTFRDLNERVSGSRKEAAALKKLQAEEILKLDNATQYERINKKLVMPEYDPHEAKEAGANAGVVYLNMKFREAVTTKPTNDPTARQIYVKFMPALLEELENAPNLSDLSTILDKYFVRGWTNHGRKIRVELLFKENILDKFKELGIEVPVDNRRELTVSPGDVFGKVFCGLAGQLTDSAKDHWKYAREIKGVTQQDIDIKKESLYLQEKSFWEKQVAKSDSKIDQLYWHQDDNLHYELINYKVLGEESLIPTRSNFKIKTDFFKRPEREREELLTILKERRKADLLEKSRDEAKIRETALEYLNNLGIELRPPDWSFLPEKEPEIEGLHQSEETKIDRKKVGDAIKQFPKLKKVIRTNGREVTDAEVTVENLHDLFGYKSVQLGNWVKDHEAREHIKHFIASMKDLEDVLGIDLKKLNETGGLSIAFGARGKSKALAHYEPMRKIINITKTKGDGSIAHEWGHFFDHYLGGAIEDKLQEQGFATAGVAPETEIQAVVKELVREITTGKTTKTVTFEPPIKTPKKQFRVFNYLMHNNTLTDEQKETRLIDEAKKLIRNYPEREREIGELAAYALKKPFTMEYEGINEFYENSMTTKNPRYWGNNQELFARAWESYIEDKLSESGIFNNYLVQGNKKDGNGEREPMHLVYPQGEFRGRLNKLFDKLIETTKLVYGVEKTRDTETKRINEVIDYSGNEGDENLFNKSIITVTDANRKTVNRELTYKLTSLLKRGRGSLKFTVSNLFNSVKTESPQKPSPAEIKKEADEHPGTFKKIQEQQIKTPADLGQAIAEDHAKAEDNKSQEKEAKEYPVYGEIDFQGLKIVVENKPGTVRSGTDPDGEQWKTKMFYPYGYIKGTKATDGEGVDVYVGKNRDSQKVFIIHQKDIATKKYDEDKVMLGFDTKESARDAYLAHYDSYQFLGEITEMSLDEFREKLKTRKGKIIKSIQDDKPVIAVDFDGVIHKYSRGWQDGEIYDDPMPGAVEGLKALSDDYRIVIHTTREDFESVWSWLREHDLDQYIESISNIKPLEAKLFIDDRGMNFKNWDDTIAHFTDYLKKSAETKSKKESFFTRLKSTFKLGKIG